MDLDAFRREVKYLRDEGKSINDIVDKLQCSKSKVQRAITYNKKNDSEGYEKRVSNNGEVYLAEVGENLTAEGLIEKYKIDEDEFEVYFRKVGYWNTSMRNGRQVKNYKAEIRYRPIKKTTIEESILNLINKKLQPVKYKSVNFNFVKEGKLWELALVDEHFGIAVYKHLSGKSENLQKTLEKHWTYGVEKQIQTIKHCKVNKVLLPIGNDFLHVNNRDGVTPDSRNILDVDGNLFDIFTIGEETLIKTILRLKEIAPVDVVLVRGNHDPHTGFYLSHIINRYFENDKNVTVDTGSKPRKAYKYGINFIGFTHGRYENLKNLPRIFMDEFEKDWSKTKYREIHTGDKHHKKKLEYITVNTVGQPIVRILPSLVEKDAWHYRQGYSSLKSCESFLFDKNEGLISENPVYVWE